MRRPSWICLLLLASPPAHATDGELDAAFGTNGQLVFGVGVGVAHARDAVTVEAGIVVVGDHETSPGNFDFFAVRLAPDGTVAGNSGPIPFDLVAGGDDNAVSIARAPGDKVVIAGTVETAPGVTGLGIVRLVAATLALDGTFGSGGVKLLGLPNVTHYGADVAVLADGSIVVGFTFGDPNLANHDFGVFKLLPGGLRDPSFGNSGFVPVAFDLGGGQADVFRALALQPDGRIVLAGMAQWGPTDYDFAVARLLANGSPDAAFGPFGTGRNFVAFDLDGNATDFADAVALAVDGRIALAGYASAAPVPMGAVAMLFPSGNLDPTFDGDGRRLVQWIGGAGVNELTGAAFESDGSLFVSGNAFLQWGSQGNLGVARLLPSGVYDCGFYGCFHMYDLAPGWEYSHATALDGGRPLLVGTREGDWAIVRLTNALILRDGFESADLRGWNAP